MRTYVESKGVNESGQVAQAGALTHEYIHKIYTRMRTQLITLRRRPVFSVHPTCVDLPSWLQMKTQDEMVADFLDNGWMDF